MKYLAKSKKFGSIPLDLHGLAVANIAVYVAKNVCGLSNDMVHAVRQAAHLHDIGKVSSKFQKWIKNEGAEFGIDEMLDNEPSIYHNVLAWAVLSTYTDIDPIDNPIVTSAILYHHPVDFRMRDLSCDKISIDHKKDADAIRKYVRLVNEKYSLGIKKLNDFREIKMPPLYSDNASTNPNIMMKHASAFTVRSILIYADRVVSSLSGNNNRSILSEVEVNNISTIGELVNSQFKMNSLFDVDLFKLNSYESSRLARQEMLVAKCHSNTTTIIGAAAGFGKTLLGLKWMLQNGKKGLWVCPINIIAFGVYDSIINEISKMGLDTSAIGLLIAGEYVHGSEDSDIIVTNIDNYLNPIVKNSVSKSLVRILSSNVVFDEFHGLVCEQPLFSAFLKVMAARHTLIKSKSLLLSATPVAYKNGKGEYVSHLQKYWEFNGRASKNKTLTLFEPSHLSSTKYAIDGGETNNLVEMVNSIDSMKDICVMANSVVGAQRVFTSADGKLSEVYHSRFTKDDLEAKRAKLKQYHDKNAPLNLRTSIASTRIVGTGLDISFQNLCESVMSPEYTLQAIGRTNRWGEIKDVVSKLYFFNCAKNANEGGAIGQIYSRSIMREWYNTLIANRGKTITLGDLYNLYYEFNTTNKDAIEKHIDKCYSESIKACKNFIPYRTFDNSKNEGDEEKVAKVYSNKNSFRGLTDNYLVVAMDDSTDSISDLIEVDNFLIEDEKNNTDAVKMVDIYKKYLFDNPKFKINKRNLNLKSGKDRKFEKLIKDSNFGKIGTKPLVLTSYKYCSRLGLHNLYKTDN